MLWNLYGFYAALFLKIVLCTVGSGKKLCRLYWPYWAGGSRLLQFPAKARAFLINARSRIMATTGITNNTLEVTGYKVQLGVKLVSSS